MRLLRPERAGMGFDEFIAYSCAPGIQALLTDVLCLNAEELRVQQDIWRKYTRTRTPAAYLGFAALFASFRARGGRVSVISHSEREVILRHYRELFGFEPDLVFGWEQPEARRKPHPWPLEETLRVLGLRPEEALLVDDLSPGFAMAAACGVPWPMPAGRTPPPQWERSCARSPAAPLAAWRSWRRFEEKLTAGAKEDKTFDAEKINRGDS